MSAIVRFLLRRDGARNCAPSMSWLIRMRQASAQGNSYNPTSQHRRTGSDRAPPIHWHVFGDQLEYDVRATRPMMPALTPNSRGSRHLSEISCNVFGLLGFGMTLHTGRSSGSNVVF